MDLPAIESRVKLKDVATVSKMFAPEQRTVVLDSLGNFGATVERVTTQAYDPFQHWFDLKTAMVFIEKDAFVKVFPSQPHDKIFGKLLEALG